DLSVVARLPPPRMLFCSPFYAVHPVLHSFPTRRSSDLQARRIGEFVVAQRDHRALGPGIDLFDIGLPAQRLDQDHLEQGLHLLRSEEHTSELQSRENLVCRLLLEKKKVIIHYLLTPSYP